MQESSYNAPRLHVAIEARKIVISGEVAGLQIQLGPPAVPGRFNSCDLPPKFYLVTSSMILLNSTDHSLSFTVLDLLKISL